MPTKLYIGNVPPTVSSTELKELFEKYGKVLECDIVKDYAFVHMEDASKAKASIAALNDFNLKGSRIRVEVSTTQLRNSSRPSRREESSRYESGSMSMRSARSRDMPMMSSSRNGSYSGGGGPDRSYPSMRNSYMDARSRPYDSPYERQRIPQHIAPMSYPDPYSRPGGDPYSMRSGGVDPYGREDFYHHRGPPMSIADHYGRGPPMRSAYDAYAAYSSGPSSMGPPRSRYPASPPSSRYGSSPRSSSRRPARRSPPPPPPSSSSRSRR
ncbi:unnamed protein product [Rotaria magnacalcarata]|uniref:RRM domain-containing protein n=1 Tax=Rotaria magnacalcarata TaxID=392030 RepID=A0A814X4M6_9BILA|nr:unnamed protein product [Rotaria magnacalcarata]CAF1610460.1 unnamed protein product [Rotaria magnacalcarata]CAF1920120.1 unnamed protein product [Rotaria magnacalcarata]CAF2073715.1 unnamed protein product [Rotaria magnacalcarata]CAF2160040.1 unnamed protein product [Rotaria magnacalcarata]